MAGYPSGRRGRVANSLGRLLRREGSNPSPAAYAELVAQRDGAIKSDAKWKRKAERRGVKYMELLDKTDRMRHEIRRLENVLIGLHKLDEPTAEIVRGRVARAVPRAIKRAQGRCPNCRGDAGDNWFDRSICPCADTMHTRCCNCGAALDGCVFESAEATEELT
jgi:hypothetical protein